MIVVSHYQIKPLLKLRGAGNVAVSPDLGLSTVTVALSEAGVSFPGGDTLAWGDAERIAEAEGGCFALENGAIRKIQVFSETTNRQCVLMPTSGAPTLLIAGFPMHRIKGIDPHHDTLNKIKAARPAGQVLDTSMGLGYTAIEAARAADRVVTVELDPAVVEIAEQNPWSRGLFSNPRIERRVGDSFDVVEAAPDGSFSCIIHDPPTMQLAGDLYSGEFYRELHRILKPRGRLFHYVGDLDSASGRRVVKGVVERLTAAGFQEVKRRPDAFGVTALK